MKISVTNFRGCAVAVFNHLNTTVIFGQRHQGKSSTAEAVRAMLTGNLIPIRGVLKRQIKNFVRDGAKQAFVEIIDGESKVSCTWPKQDYKSEGKAFRHINEISAGLASIPKMKLKERAEPLSKYIDAVPTPEDIRKELRALKFSDDAITSLLKHLETYGFDVMESKVREKGTKIKGAWEEITGERYGSEKSESWFPSTWQDDLMDENEDNLQAVVRNLTEETNLGIAAAKANEVQATDLQAQADLIEPMEQFLKAAAFNLKKFRADETYLQKKLLKIQSAKDEQHCYHCGGMLHVINGQIAEPKDEEMIDNEELKKDEPKVANNLRETRIRITNTLKEQAEKELKLKHAREAEKILDQIKTGEKIKWDKNLDEVQKRLENAKIRLQAFQTWQKASEKNDLIVTNIELVKLLGPNGIRKTKLVQALIPMNKLMQRLSEAAGWPITTMNKDYQFLFNEKPYEFCSKSERFQIRVVNQIAIAGREKARTVVIDGIDILSGKDKIGLLKMLQKCKMPALLFCTTPSFEKIPKLGELGETYFINEGEIK